MSFSNKDIKQIEAKGISIEHVNSQVERLKAGTSFSNIIEAAAINNGIERFNDNDLEFFIKLYQSKQNSISALKFVPASGAATRMFKFLFLFLKAYNPKNQDLDSYIKNQKDDLLLNFIDNLESLPFYKDVVDQILKQKIDYYNLPKDKQCLVFVQTMLDKNQLNYSAKPKGLLPFHKYKNKAITAFQEHLYEASLYAASNGVAHLHFTVSKQHHDFFVEVLNTVQPALEQELNTVFKVSFSYQKEQTETLALTEDNTIFRTQNDAILFRPAGHGALIENLNDLDSDIIFIKNIDNIAVAHTNINLSRHKKLLAGVLLQAQEQVFRFLHKIDEGDVLQADLNDMVNFAKQKLNVCFPLGFDNDTMPNQIKYLKNKLNRPLRVCGIVKNVGEPGGGPFWVQDQKGNLSLQIVEFAQIDFDNKKYKEIASKATHFSPTDLVCGVKNYRGEKFNLLDYVDPEAAFITMKTQDGVAIKALELPGLWNGSMAYWNSIFVEVPLNTFNPVKTVNDLLKPAHQVEHTATNKRVKL